VDSGPVALRPLATDDRAAASVGRQARLELTFGRRGSRTVLTHSYAEPPFRVGRVLPDGDGVHLILASSAPGIFGGDCLSQSINVEPGARVRLTSQSAIQIHPNDTGTLATLRAAYRVEAGGHLACEWDPLIPFADARFEQRIQIDLAPSATLVWSDALMAGREARGERWCFAHLSHELRLVRAQTLAYMERYTIAGDRIPDQRWTGDTACYFGTVLVVGEQVDEGLAGRVHQSLAASEQLRGSADALKEGLLLARLAGRAGVSFHAARAAVVKACHGPRQRVPHEREV
jgi:urease accessory protein